MLFSASRPLELPCRKAPRMDVMLLEAGRAAVMSEVDLDFELVLCDGEIADRTGDAATVGAPGAIRRARRQCPPSDRRARLSSKPQLVRHLAKFRSPDVVGSS